MIEKLLNIFFLSLKQEEAIYYFACVGKDSGLGISAPFLEVLKMKWGKDR